ncbi:chemotaxis protein CheW [Rhizosaccharibacter radicis]|uniref:Chemotaxis protein CheW n=1 Tax=Rhizosaccharibacter radicis TaxID=2782605 RepID=A0ABT1VX74_9PROT|nr:chemotaxis protein CheW [Acetobacteraceae bacterium KSS12]
MPEPVLLFTLAGQCFALPVAEVSECLPLPRLWRRAGTSPHVAGFFSLGGDVVPVLALGSLLGLPTPEDADGVYRHLILAGNIALLVDRVTGLAEWPDDSSALGDGRDVLASQEAAHGATDDMSEGSMPPGGTAADASSGHPGGDEWRLLPEGPVRLLRASRLLAAEERERLAVLRRDAERRRSEWEDDVPAAGGAGTDAG